MSGADRGGGDVARTRARMPAGTHRVLGSRTLAGGNPPLARLLRPGMHVLDVGCGSGAITAGIARAVGPSGRVVGVDLGGDLLAIAREAHQADGLSFAEADATNLPESLGAFDVVTCARLLQWLAAPEAAVASMARRARPGGILQVLDYDHEAVEWSPEVPADARRLYDAFLAWRAEAGCDNRVARRLGALLRDAGLVEVAAAPCPERHDEGSGDPASGLAIWAEVARTRGHQVVAAGAIDEDGRRAGEEAFDAWARRPDARQTLTLVSAVGRVPTA